MPTFIRTPDPKHGLHGNRRNWCRFFRKAFAQNVEHFGHHVSVRNGKSVLAPYGSESYQTLN